MTEAKRWVRDEKVAVVSGASRGIGRAVALELAARGYALVLIARNSPDLVALERSMRDLGHHVTAIPTDLSSDEQVNESCERIRTEFESIAVLVHCAGILEQGNIQTSRMTDFDRVFRLNARAALSLTQQLLPRLITASGQVIFVNSSVTNAPARAGQSGYAASKYALRAIADSLRAEVNDLGVRVTSIYPGRTATPMQQSLAELEAKPYVPEVLLQPEDIAATIAAAA